MNDKIFRFAPLMMGLIGLLITVCGYLFIKFLPTHYNWAWLLIGLLNLAAGIGIGLQYRQLYLDSTKDFLTGLNNRRNMYRRIDRELKKAGKRRTAISLLLIDIDNFKAINDTKGHTMGDLVLKQVSDILHRSVRYQDLVFRWGGEEFAILLPKILLDKAVEIAERTRQTVERHVFKHEDSQIKVTISIGVYTSHQNTGFQPMFQAADQALYQAKKTKNAVSAWQS